ncbi:RHS repeat-associated core domain-containing protein, partial [Rhizomonospora bruguierae]|uniref:RHS repeat-associated core domain-containing protein n=1 Tax=Rhizomonospora bruguierae TaxID=1581705 RepID=UPI001BCD16BF
TTPFGAMRGAASGVWPSAMDKGFVGGTGDPSGLTHLGARQYDPEIGRFASVDPVIDSSNPQQMNGFAYANNSPATSSDPTGLYPGCSQGGGKNRGCHDGTGNRPNGSNSKSSSSHSGDKWRDRPTVAWTTLDRATIIREVKLLLDQPADAPCFHGTRGIHDCENFMAWSYDIVRFANEAGVDPRLLMSVLAIEVGRSDELLPIDNLVQFGSWALDQAGAYGFLKEHLTGKGDSPPSLGWGNIQERAFNETVARHWSVLGGIDWSDLMGNHELSIKVTAYRLRDLMAYADAAPAGMRRDYSRDEVAAAIYNIGTENFADSVKAGNLGPLGSSYARAVRDHYDWTDAIICGSGLWECY